jgi:MFS family permease
VTLVAALASTIFMPLEAWLLERLGWRTALATLALILGVITIPIHALVLRPSPHRKARAAAGSPDLPGMSLGAAARRGMFWVLAVAFFVGNFTTNSVTVHLIPYLSARGYSPALAAAMIGWMGAMQLPARLVFGPITARLGHTTITAVIFFVQAAALIQLALAAHLPTLAPVVVILGAANGTSTLARATIIAELFGPRHYGSISGAIALGANGARALAPVGAALLQVALGGYERVFGLLAVSLLLAGVGVMMTRRVGQ